MDVKYQELGGYFCVKSGRFSFGIEKEHTLHEEIVYGRKQVQSNTAFHARVTAKGAQMRGGALPFWACLDWKDFEEREYTSKERAYMAAKEWLYEQMGAIQREAAVALEETLWSSPPK